MVKITPPELVKILLTLTREYSINNRYYKLNSNFTNSFFNNIKTIEERKAIYDQEKRERKKSEQSRELERIKRADQRAEKIIMEKYADGLYHEQLGHGQIKSVSFTDNQTNRYVNIVFDNQSDVKSYNLDDSFEKGILKTTPFETRPEPTPYEKQEEEKEKEHLQKAVDYCVEQSKKRYKGRDESIDDYVGRDRNFNAQDYLDDMETNKQRSKWIDASNDPYIMAINSKKYKKIYIGKSGDIGDDIYDWRNSSMAHLYYNRNVLISDKDIGISLIRDIHRNLRVFKDYTDIYNTEAPQDEKRNISNSLGLEDEIISKIAEQKKQKRVHDIIETIQKEQYEIISDDRDMNFIVDGIAGSGKTMVLFHKISFDAFKESFDPSEICVISSSTFLNEEAKKLCKDLKIDEIANYTTTEFYKSVVLDVAEKSKSSFLFEVKEKSLSDKFNPNVYNPGLLLELEKQANKIADDVHKYVNFTSSQKGYFDDMLPKLFGVKSIHFKDTDDLNELINKNSERRFNNIAKKNAKVANGVNRFIAIRDSLRYIPAINVRSIISSNQTNYSNERKTQYKFLLDYFLPYLNGTADYLKKDNRYDIQVNSVDGLVKFNDLTTALDNSIKKSLVNPFVSGPSFLVDFYDYMNLSSRLASYRNQLLTREASYLIYVADWCIANDNRFGNDLSIENYYFLMMYLVNSVLDIKFTQFKKVYIDEYQNYSISELKAIISMCPNSKFNFYGDIMQKIEDKGLKTLDELELLNVQKYTLKANYRNSYDVCRYLADTFNLQVTPIGLDGRVQEITESFLEKYIPKQDDRVCLIAKDLNKYKDLLKCYCIPNKDDGLIERGVINLMSLDQIKGLEFEVVFVDITDMKDNEHYLSASRSLRELFILNKFEE